LRRDLYDETHELFRSSVRTFIERDVVPHYETWDADGIVDKGLFRRAGDAGFFGIAVPEQFGGAGISDFRFNAIMTEEACRVGVYPAMAGIAMQADMCLPYFLHLADDDQKKRWLPGVATGESVIALAMTEPNGGSDLARIRTTAIRDGDEYVVNGAKTFITNAHNCDLVVVACKTDPAERHRGTSLIVVEAERAGFTRGRNLAKVGQHAADTGELFFDDVRIPITNRLGAEGAGFANLMRNLPQERLSVAISGLSMAQAGFDWTLEYVKERHAFGQSIGSFQHNRFLLAEMRTELDIAQVYLDHQIRAHNAGELTAQDAAAGKWWCTELCKRVIDGCVQLHGGYGYMEEYPIARAWRDARVLTIYAGTTEIMKEIVGRNLGL
jgi:alkylation response protein AidB-like acyl-CoA dehydrogenase